MNRDRSDLILITPVLNPKFRKKIIKGYKIELLY